MIHITIATLLLAVGLRWLSIQLAYYGKKFPPSPPSDPIIGYLRKFPTSHLDMHLYNLGKKLGAIFNLRLPGHNIVVLNAVKPAIDLFGGKSAIYSDRPHVPLAELCGVADTVGFMSLDDEFHLHRRVLNKYLGKGKFETPEFHSSLQRHATVMVQGIVPDKADNVQKHFLFYSTAVITEFAFGHRLEPRNEEDPYYKLAYDATLHGFPAIKPHGSEITDVLPFLTKLPSWLPLNKHVTNARKASKVFKIFREFPYIDVKKKLNEGRAAPSIVASEIADAQDGNSNLTREQIQALISPLFHGGIETMVASLAILTAALVLHPEAQVKAHEEIERVIGSDRLPEFSDRSSLPYIECLMQEVIRWRPVVPLGLPRLLREDDTYNGYFIPKKSIVFGNVTAMSLDESVYKDPTKFDPSRFMPQPEGRGEPHFSSAFGFGRRICPGRFLAADTLWIAVVTFLATVKISRPLDSLSQEYVPDIEWEVALTCHPHPFPCRISARNPKVESMLIGLVA